MSNLIHHINRYLFDSDFYDSPNLFITSFDELPSKLALYDIDGEKGCTIIDKEFAGKILQRLQSTKMTAATAKERLDQRHYVMEGKIVVEIGTSWCYIYHCPKSDTVLIEQLKSKLKGVKKRARREPLEMNLICHGKNGLYLKGVEVKRTRLDVSLYYNDEFRETDETIRRRLNRKADKGIVLLHGIPGTGKTTYLRYLVGKIKKRVLFVPPEGAGRISNPELLQLLVDNPDSVLIIEDAENIIMQRQAGFDSSLSNLLNISDGLLSDFLNVQLICTFNSALSTVDEALLRKGRLIARYEFGRLSVGKAQRLSRHLGFHAPVTRPMTIAEIANQHEAPATEPVRQLIGFRRELMTT